MTVTFFGVWWIEDTHAYASDAVIVLVVLHIAGVVAMSLLQRENLIRAMITGRKRIRSGSYTSPEGKGRFASGDARRATGMTHVVQRLRHENIV